MISPFSKHGVLAACLLSAASPVCHAQSTGFDPGGPIEYPGMKVMAEPGEVQAPGYHFADDCLKPIPWQAQWIWTSGDAPNAAWFRKEVILDAAPAKARAWLTADTKYRLWINGRLVSRGPVDIGMDYAGGSTHRWFYDFRDLTPYFKKGRNVVAAEVYRKWPVGFTVSRGKPGLLFEAQVDGITVKSDATWKAVAAGHPSDWQAPGFDDAAWPAANPVENVWQPLVPSEIPPLMEARYPVTRLDGLPADKTITKDGSFHVVFDRVLSGFPTLMVTGGKGATVTIKAHKEYHTTLCGGEQRIEFPFMDEIVASYTVTVSHLSEPVRILDAGAYFTSQPVEYRGAFECSDEKLNQVWKVSRWAVQMCLQSHHLDSPNHQEPISDPGDYLIEAMVNHYAFAQPWLARQDLRKFAWLLKDQNYRNFHTSYSIGWLQMLMDYLDFTGDKSLVVEMAPYVNGLLDTYASWRGKNGILSEAPNYMFMDWVNINGIACHHPPAVIGQGYLTAFFYHGLEMGIRVAALTGDSDRVRKYTRLRSEISTAFNRELWVPDKGLYRDGKPFQTSVKPGKWLPADTDMETFSPHVNLLAVLYDLAPGDRQEAVVRKVLSEEPLNTQPWFMHWVFQAIDHAGLFDEFGTPQLRRWRIVGETQSFREMWNGGDLSHGWCSTPLVQMSARVLGVSPLEPGFKTISIRPAICDLTYAKGKVPTPLGDVSVSWTLSDGTFALDVAVPPGSDAVVTLPASRFDNPTILRDGVPIKATARVPAGKHHFEVKGKFRPFITAVGSHSVLDKGVVADDLIHRFLLKAEDRCGHAGGGRDASALFNGTTLNDSGGETTEDDGATFRGYGEGDWLLVRFKKPCRLEEIRTFSNHNDSRASQNYTVLIARGSAPEQFVKLTEASKPASSGPSELRVPAKAEDVVGVRLEFHDGPAGFNVYREINMLGQPSDDKP